MLQRILSSLCVLATALPLAAGAGETTLKPIQIAGRWQGDSWASDKGGPLTLDIVACGAGWCGIKVEAGDKCGGTALKIDAGAVEGDYLQYKGTLQLAPNTEPYVVQTSIFAPEADDPPGSPLKLQITGDTGGEFRAYRRSFPFEAQLARVKDAVCQAPANVSSLY
jgi:hypothetical protein